MAKATKKASATKTKKATPMTKKIKPRMEFLLENATEDQRKESNRIWRDFGMYVYVNDRQYKVERVHFYNKDGVVYTSRNMEAPKTPDSYDQYRYRQIKFDKDFVWKRQIKFDSGELMLKSLGKDPYYPYGLTCELYVPVEYLEADGAMAVVEKSEGRYDRYIYKYLRSKHLEIHLESKSEDFFETRLKDFIARVEKATSEEDIKRALSDTMNIYAR